MYIKITYNVCPELTLPSTAFKINTWIWFVCAAIKALSSDWLIKRPFKTGIKLKTDIQTWVSSELTLRTAQ